jgi:hypothetical protein
MNERTRKDSGDTPGRRAEPDARKPSPEPHPAPQPQTPVADAQEREGPPPEAPYPPEDDGAPTRDNRHPDARKSMTGEAPGG